MANVELNDLLEEHHGQVSFFGNHMAMMHIKFKDKDICLIFNGDEYPRRRLICEAAFSGVRCGTNCLNTENDSDMVRALEQRQ